MKLIKLFVGSLAFIMFFAIIYGFLFSSFSKDGKALLEIVWGVITLVDIYIMFTLFSLWILYREGFNIKSVLLVISVMVLGSLAASLYALYAPYESRGNWNKFWLGKKD